MRICGFFYLACFIVFISCVSYSSPDAKVIPNDYFGIIPDHGDGPQETENEFLDQLGVVWLRKTFYWSSIESDPGIWDFSDYDDFIESRKAAGKKILIILAYDTGWLYSNGKRQRNITEERLPYYLRYVDTLVRRYRGKVDAWEIWNEPNWIFWKGKKKDFYALSKAAAQTIREADPDALIVAGAVNRVPKSFLRGMINAGAFDEADIISFHPYDINPEGSLRLYDSLANFLVHEGIEKTIWVTEVGYPAGGLYPTRISSKKFPSYLIKTMAGLAVRGAEVSFWYELCDSFNPEDKPSPFDSELYFGLAYPDYRPKPGAAAYALCSHFLAGRTYRPDYPERENIPPSVESLCFTDNAGNGTLLIWKKSGPKTELEVYCPGINVRLYNVYTGESSAIPSQGFYKVGSVPLFFTWSKDSGIDPATAGPAIAGYSSAVPRLSLPQRIKK
jgi:hypothetical protein